MGNKAASSKETPSSELSSLDKIWMNTKVKVYESRHIWKINNFKSLPQEYTTNLSSERFSAPGNDNLYWSLGVRLRSDDPHNVVLEMRLSRSVNHDDNSSTYAKYRLIIYDCTKKEAKVISNMHVFNTNSNYILEDMWSVNDIVSADKEIVSNDVLTVGCQIKYFHGMNNFEVPNWDTEIMNSKFHCYDTLERMFKNKKFSDVKININGRTFEAHKAILAAASPVFLAMFESSMTEAQHNYINIDDVDEETFEEMLRFIYTGDVNNIEKVAYTLFAAADKYAIDELKKICQNKLCKDLTADNAVSVLLLSDVHSAVELKEKVIEFITIERVDVTKTEDFKSMIDSHHDLFAEVMRALL